MADVRFDLNSAWFDEALHGDIARQACRPKAERVLARAVADAPVDEGDYRASLHIEEVQHPTRLVFQVIADVPHAMYVEAETGNLARSLDG